MSTPANDPHEEAEQTAHATPLDVPLRQEEHHPHDGMKINLSWEDLSYTIGDKHILTHMSGRLVAGAILRPDGRLWLRKDDAAERIVGSSRQRKGTQP